MDDDGSSGDPRHGYDPKQGIDSPTLEEEAEMHEQKRQKHNRYVRERFGQAQRERAQASNTLTGTQEIVEVVNPQQQPQPFPPIDGLLLHPVAAFAGAALLNQQGLPDRAAEGEAERAHLAAQQEAEHADRRAALEHEAADHRAAEERADHLAAKANLE